MKKEQLYYDQGYFVTKLPNYVIAYLWNEIYNTEWIIDKKENIYKQIPSWYISNTTYDVGSHGEKRADFEREIGREILHKAPESIKYLSEEVLACEDLSFFRKYYKNSETMYIDLWNGAEEIPYHFDTINGADTLLLIYLTEQQDWKDDWGGQISLKKQVNDVIIKEETVNPLNGTMVVINNANPLVMHKVNALRNKDINRYTFSFNYKWF